MDHLSIEETGLVREVTVKHPSSLYSLLAEPVEGGMVEEPLIEEAFDHFIDMLEEHL